MSASNFWIAFSIVVLFCWLSLMDLHKYQVTTMELHAKLLASTSRVAVEMQSKCVKQITYQKW